MKKTPALSFYEWLVLFRDVDRPIGDLAQDALRDPDFPKHKTLKKSVTIFKLNTHHKRR